MELYNHKFIILGSYTANTLGQIRGLGEKGINPIAVLVHKNTYRVDKSRYILELYNVNSIEEGLELILNKFGNETYKPFLYTDRDDVVGLFDSHYEDLIDKFYFWNAGGKCRLAPYLNKGKQLELAEKCGFRIPKTEIVKVGELPKHLSYPIFTKSVDSLNRYWKGNAYICNNEEELKAAYNRMDVKEIILQEYIDKKDEHPIEGISLSGGAFVRLYVKSVNYRLTKDSFGIYRHLEQVNDIVLENKVKQFLKRINYTGVFEIEFIESKNGDELFLETNFRISQYNFAYTQFGVNFPYLYAKAILEGEDVLNDINYSSKRPFNVMSEFDDLKYSVLKGNTSLLEWIKDAWRIDCFSFYDKKDKSPFYYTLIAKFLNFIVKKVGC